MSSEIDELTGSKGALIFDEDLNQIKKIPLRRLYSIDLGKEPYVIAIDGTATHKVIDICERLGCSNLIATNFIDTDTKINLVSI